MSETLTRTRPVRQRPQSNHLRAYWRLAFWQVWSAARLLPGLEASGFSFSIFLDPYLQRIARFTIWQAVLSSLLSVLFAIPVARALYSEARFPGRGLILRLFALPLALPALVTVLGITSIYGRNGFVAQLSQTLGYPVQPDIYGLTGILIAHVFSICHWRCGSFWQPMNRFPLTTGNSQHNSA